MRCDKCKNKLKVQQTVTNYSDNKIIRRRFCPICRTVYISEEVVVDSYPLLQEQSLYLQNIE